MSENPQVQRQYKDTVFRDLFGRREYALSLFNAVTERDYPDTPDFKIVTLSNVLYCTMSNDLAVSIVNNITLFEHQSTVNPNMPYRSARYMFELYDKWYDANRAEIAQQREKGILVEAINLFGSKLVKFPAPKCYVLYNGEKDQPERFEQHLSDAFLEPSPGYEWTVHVININLGYNKKLMQRSEALNGYSMLVGLSRKYYKAGIALKDAVNKAIDDCINQDILSKYLRERKEEVFNIMTFEYDHKQEVKDSYLEGIDVGRAQGIDIGRTQGIDIGRTQGIDEERTRLALNMIAEKFPIDSIARLSNLPVSKIEALMSENAVSV